MNPIHEKVIKFLATAASDNVFPIGAITITNLAVVTSSNGGSANAQLPINITRGEVLGISTIKQIAGIKTGYSTIPLALVLALLVANSYLAYAQSGFGKKRAIMSLINEQSQDKNRFNFIE